MARIFVIDDDPDFQDLARMILEVHGHEVGTFDNAAEAFEAMGSRHPDAVILDLILGGIDGFEALERLRGEPATARVPALVVSALQDSRYRIRAFRTGADDFLVKPVVPEELLARMQRLIQRTQGLSLEGAVESYSLTELLQGMEQGTRSGLVRLAGSEGDGWVALHRGVVTAARSGRLSGMEAALRLLEMADARFVLEPPPREVASKDPGLPVTDLLMQKGWLGDEVARRSGILPAASRGLRWIAPGATESPGLPSRLLQRIESLPGVTLAELIEHQLASPLRTSYAVAQLLELGLVGVEPE